MLTYDDILILEDGEEVSELQTSIDHLYNEIAEKLGGAAYLLEDYADRYSLLMYKREKRAFKRGLALGQKIPEGVL